MSEEGSSARDGYFDGTVLFYSQPELLTVEDHGELGINPSAQSFNFARPSRALPLTLVEMVEAQRNYPVVFTGIERPSLVAVVGVFEDANLFIDEKGQWEPTAYIPAYVRCYPFALVARQDDQLAVIIDRTAPVISEQPELPFFDGSALTPEIEQRVDMCGQYHAQVSATRHFCNKLAEYNLLKGQELTFTPQDGGEEQSLGAFVAVDFEKLQELDTATLQQFHKDGTLGAIYAHRFSLDMWRRLLERYWRRGQSS